MKFCNGLTNSLIEIYSLRRLPEICLSLINPVTEKQYHVKLCVKCKKTLSLSIFEYMQGAVASRFPLKSRTEAA